MRLLLVDTSSYLFRAYHAVGDLRTRAGEATGAIYGVAQMLAKLRRDYPAAVVVCALDSGGPTFRHKLFPAYKANRPPIAPDLAAQFAPAIELIRAMGFADIAAEQMEADDIIATLARRARERGMDVVISSGDKDLMQLVGDGVIVADAMRGIVFDEAGVRAKFGVAPGQMLDFLTLTGDAADNVPGVDKVGPKTAAKWLAQYGDLDSLLSHAEEIPKKVGENLRAAAARLPQTRELLRVRDDVNLSLDLDNLAPHPPDKEKLQALCERFEFKFLDKLISSSPPPSQTDKKEYRAITELAELQKWIDEARREKQIGLDTETDTLDALRATPVGFSLARKDGAVYVPLAHKGETAMAPPPTQIKTEDAIAALRPLLEDEEVLKVGHNLKFDLHVFANCGARASNIGDSQIAGYVRDPAGASGLDALAKRWLDRDTIKYKEIVDGKTAKVFSDAPINAAARYAAEDADVALQLYGALRPGLSPAARKVYEEIDLPLLPVLLKMERAGVLIDSKALAELSASFIARMEAAQSEARKIAGGEFNLNSTRQLGEILFDKFNLPVLRRTPGGARSTDESVLEKLAADAPIARAVLEYRQLAKLNSTYAAKLPKMINPQSGRVHTNFNQTAVATGRLASSEPNLQNIPIRGTDGKKIRAAFIAAPGFVLVAADYSQIELRLAAHLSGDEGLIRAFAADEDIHRRTAAEIFNVAPDAVGAEQRRFAKTVNFGLLYGMSAYGLSESLGVPTAQAKEYIARYFARYPKVKLFMEKTRQAAAADGFVETIFGRRLPIRQGGGGRERRAAGRAAINAPMQGSAADLIKLAMIKVAQFLDETKSETRLILQVHDELVLEAPRREWPLLQKHLPPLMCEVARLQVPLKINLAKGANWAEAH